ncbi:MAG TPA: phosphoribosylglycinamide formyltransferase [Bacteroidia bacterium]|jgi:phosphoribosylglycinamide formyltransferase-1|nr:phosphoribosylglycinamide formyltransferase [Bacteroidia bacterium]HQK98623.1 phosphoribosylglycinamide formyltransferase [Bacteroidia bacterium]
MKTLALFASGKGSNADNICSYFKNHSSIQVGLICSDRKEAGVFDVAEKHHVKSIYLSKSLIQNPSQIVDLLREHNIDYVILAGYLKLIPKELTEAFKGCIINIHPALLPSFGGKGMFGMHVHEAVAAAGVSETGITIHHVNEHYDEGAVIFQARTSLDKSDTPQTIAKKIAALEMENFPRVIEELIEGNKG